MLLTIIQWAVLCVALIVCGFIGLQTWSEWRVRPRKKANTESSRLINMRRLFVHVLPGKTWQLRVKWPYTGPLWTEQDGWHPKLRKPVEQLLREAQQQSVAPMLVSPLVPQLPYIPQAVAANGVLAVVEFDVELGEQVCQLLTMEVFPEV